MQIIEIVSLVLIYSLASFGIGWLVYFISLKLSHNEKADVHYLSWNLINTLFLLGLSVYGSIWLILGLIGEFSPRVVWSFIGLGLICGVHTLFKRKQYIRAQIVEFWQYFVKETIFWKLLIVLIMIYCVSFFSVIGSALAADAAYFYMTMPKVLADSQILRPIPGKSIYETFGFVGEMHHAALISLGNEDSVKLFSLPLLLSCLFMIGAIGRKVGLKQRGQWITAVIFLTTPAVIWFIGEGKVDTIALAFALGSIYWVIKGEKPFLAGIFLGSAILAKNPYLVSLGPAVAIILIWQQLIFQKDYLQKKFITSFLKFLRSTILPIGIGIILIFIPFFLKNYIYFKDLLPISFFASGGLFKWNGWDNTPYTKRIYLTYFLDLTYNIRGISPLWLAFSPLILFDIRQIQWSKSSIAILSLAALIGNICMIIVFPAMLFEVRFYLPVLVLLIPIVAYSAENISFISNSYRWLNLTIKLALLSIIVWAGLWFSSQNVPVFEFKQTIHYLNGELSECQKSGDYGVLQPRCSAMVWLNKNTKPGTRILTNAFHTYWLRADLLQCVNSEFYPDEPDNISVLWEKIYKQGYHYLLYDKDYAIYLQGLNIENPPQWVNLLRVFEHGPMSIYEIEYLPRESAPEQVFCNKASREMWSLVYP